MSGKGWHAPQAFACAGKARRGSELRAVAWAAADRVPPAPPIRRRRRRVRGVRCCARCASSSTRQASRWRPAWLRWRTASGSTWRPGRVRGLWVLNRVGLLAGSCVVLGMSARCRSSTLAICAGKPAGRGGASPSCPAALHASHVTLSSSALPTRPLGRLGQRRRQRRLCGGGGV